MNKTKTTALISVILPVYNEAANIESIHDELVRVLRTLPYAYEILFISDGSSDDSWEIIRHMAAQNPCVRGVTFSRNFGHQAALSAGYAHARGDAVITLDADGQDPPNLIPALVHQWEGGYLVVYARRRKRYEGTAKRFVAYFYYKFLSKIAHVAIPRNVGDFRLIDKKVLAVINQMNEHSLYFRGLVAWTGFSSALVDFDRPERERGRSGYTWGKMFHLAFNGFTGFTLFPLKIAGYIGFFVIITGTAMLLYILIDFFAFETPYPLYKWLTTIIYIFLGVQFILMWLLGEYVGRMYDEQRQRPLYIVQDKVNVDASNTDD